MQQRDSGSVTMLTQVRWVGLTDSLVGKGKIAGKTNIYEKIYLFLETGCFHEFINAAVIGC